MNLKKLLQKSLFICMLPATSFAQVNVDVNLNMKHSVDGVSNFGRERRMTIHSSLTRKIHRAVIKKGCKVLS